MSPKWLQNDPPEAPRSRVWLLTRFWLILGCPGGPLGVPKIVKNQLENPPKIKQRLRASIFALWDPPGALLGLFWNAFWGPFSTPSSNS